MDDLQVNVLGLGAALGIGLLIGVEREKSKGSGPGRSAAGVRTAAHCHRVAATVTVVLFVAPALRHYLGNLGAVVGISLAGFADAHSSAVSAASLARSGGLEPQVAVLAILLAFSTNTVTKGVVAWVTGGPRPACCRGSCSCSWLPGPVH